MRKVYPALVLCLLLSLTAASQLRMALAGGAHDASILEENSLPGWDSLKNNYSPRRGFHFGFILDVPFSPRSSFYLQSGGMYYQKGRKFAASFDTATSAVASESGYQYTNYIDVPLNLLLKLKLGRKTKLIMGGGPYASFLFNGAEKKETHYKTGYVQTEEDKDLDAGSEPGQYMNFDYGANALFGFEVGRIFLTANYSRGFGDFYRPLNYEGSFRHQVIGGTFGVLLGKAKTPQPKVKDKDKDGIPDAEDNCPADKGETANKGCPDRDGDGVVDKDDKCPDQAGVARNNGCAPVEDTDKDGVKDELDKCPEQPGELKYNGCPVPDTDKDGVTDEYDKCITVAGSVKYNGCPVPDTDKDGVNDEEDKCPTVKGLVANKGCPEIKKEIIKKVDLAARKIQFEYRSSVLMKKTHKVLDEVIAVLKENPELKISIEGHTSNDGIYEDNMKLSQQRANSVRKYLISKGIDADRITAKGYGPSKPLNKGKTEAEKSLNRRVELKLSNQ